MIFIISGCNGEEGQKGSFLQIGEFAINKVSEELTIIRDGVGRELALIPRHAQMPKGYPPEMVVRVPVQRVVVHWEGDVAALRALKVLDQTLVGVTKPKEEWYIDEVVKGFDEGRIAYLGRFNAINYELLKKQQPELVITWEPSWVPMFTSLEIPCIVMRTPVAMCLNTRISYAHVLAPFFGKENEADAYVERINSSLMKIREITRGRWEDTKIIWGDMYEKRVVVEPGNASVAELVAIVQSDYLFEDIYGAACIEISMERFLYSGQDADIYFTYRTPQSGATSKAALKKQHPLMADIKPLGPEGRVYAPLPIYYQSDDKLDEIFTEIAAIIHPDVYPHYQLKYFRQLPDVDPEG